MNNDILFKITKIKEIQKELEQTYKTVIAEDTVKINEVWNDKNTDLFLDNYKGIKKDIEKIEEELDYVIEVLSRNFDVKEEELS